MASETQLIGYSPVAPLTLAVPVYDTYLVSEYWLQNDIGLRLAYCGDVTAGGDVVLKMIYKPLADGANLVTAADSSTRSKTITIAATYDANDKLVYNNRSSSGNLKIDEADVVAGRLYGIKLWRDTDDVADTYAGVLYAIWLAWEEDQVQNL